MPTYTCPGLHCGGCHHGGGGSGGWRAIVAVVVVLAVAGAVRAAWHVIVTAVEVLAIAGVCVAGLAVLAVVSYAVYRVRLAVLAARSRPAPYRVEVITDVPARRPAPSTAALEAPRIRPAGWPLGARDGAEDAGMVGRYVD